MNNFTKALYEHLSMDINLPFIEQLEKKGNKKVFLKLNKLLQSKEYEIISSKLDLKDVRGFMEYHYFYFLKWHENLSTQAKNHYKGRYGQKEHIKNDIKKLNDMKKFLTAYKVNEDGTKYKKFQAIGFINELLSDLKSNDTDFKMAFFHSVYKLSSPSKAITDELKSYNCFTKREIEDYSKRINKIQKSPLSYGN